MDFLAYLDTLDYKQFVLGFSCAVYGFEQYLNYRQYNRYLMRDRPSELADIVTEEDFKKAQAYNLDKSRFGFIEGFYKQIETVLMLYYDALPAIWNYAGHLLNKFVGYGPEYEITQSLVFLTLFSLLSTVTSTPFSLYSTFVVEQRHGFNKQTIGLFFMDLLKSHLIMAVLMFPFMSAFIWIIQSTGDNFYFYVWLIVIMFQLFIITVYPTYIQPLFNKLTPMEQGELRTRIEELAARIKFPLKKLYVIDGSKRSGHSNAYFYGFGKNKHIVLYDTLIEHSNNDEICAVLAHELGHWKMGHTLKLLAVNQVYLLSIFWLFSFFIHNRKVYQDFGFHHSMPTLIGFLLFQFIYSPVESVIGFLMHVYQRKNEYEADAYALKLGYASTLRSALIKLSVKNLGGFNVDPWYSAWNHSHPSLVERLKALGVKPTSDKPIIEQDKKEL
ncbi:peptidase family M48-domain-containing protein [Gilbertella persicaria]|uniref:peptidase family M48-domain-containing protein n=1 Tax=Gilbertella persicaria TaxID=101096 RepID=UPI00222081C8|nr:peptidase family M48-domain-containing protein [Gilbertella persicaria]KAI8097916.1 peptidase family M48-domain-containing protein [Gilbertella persicaria]